MEREGETLPGALGPWKEKEGPSLEPWGHGERRRDSPWSPRAPGSTLSITQEAGVPPHVSWPKPAHILSYMARQTLQMELRILR